MAVVFIDSTQNFWSVSGGFVRLTVSNTFSAITISTNIPNGFGFNTNNSTRSFDVLGRQPATVAAATATTAATTGAIRLTAANGGDTTNTTTATGGVGGGLSLAAGAGGNSVQATTNATGGAGGAVTLSGGQGGNHQTFTDVATNANTGGVGGAITMTSGAGGRLDGAVAPTNAVGGNGGALTISSGQGGSPQAGWAQKGGNGGTFLMASGSGGSGVRTNGGNGGNYTMSAGAAGNTTSGGDPGIAGTFAINGGVGGTGATNGNGGNIFLRGGDPGSTATPGNIYVGRSSAGPARGGLVIGLGEFTVTNMVGGSASLDFPSTATLANSDLPIAVTGVTSNGCSVVLGVPWEAASGGGSFTHFVSNNAVFVRFSNNTALSIDPTPATFTAIVLKNQ